MNSSMRSALLCLVLSAFGAVPVEAASNIQSTMIPSAALGRDVSADIYLPPGYDPAENYRMVVLLHGQSSSPVAFRDLGFYRQADALIEKGEIVPMIMVAPSIDNSFGVNSDTAATVTIEGMNLTINYPEGAYEDFIVTDLIGYMASNYPVGRTGEDRVIAGISMGGYAALRLGLAHPEFAARVAGHSPAVVDRGFDWLYPDEAAWQARGLPNLAGRYEDKGQSFFIDCGEQDGWGFLEPVTALAGILADKGADLTWQTGHGGHDGAYWAQHVKEYLRFYGAP